MTSTFKCPNCGEKIEISQAFRHEVEEQIESEVSKKHKEELETLKEKLQKELEEGKSLEFADLKKQLEERNKKVEEFRENELKLREEKRQIEEEKKDLKLEVQRQLDERRKEFEEQVLKQAAEEHRLKDKEKDKVIDDLKSALEVMRRRAEQGSQQLQGEVLEIDLEEKLKNAFVYDEIVPIGKGVQGADILQNVRNQAGKVAGVIMWETKRAKWTPSWIAKLKEDGRKNNATMSVLVCENPPSDIEYFKVIEGVIVTSIPYFLSIAGLLRRNLMLIAQAKSASVNKDEKLEMLYEYIQSDAFRHRFEAFADGVKAMEEDLLAERRSMERIWKKRETQLKRMQLNTSRMFGELQGVMQGSLPDIKTLSLDSGE